MGLMSEDFIRCGCGSADFEMKEIVSISKASIKAKRIIETDDESSRDYYCINCGRKYIIPTD